MDELGLLQELLTIFVVSSVVVYIVHLVKFPPMVGLLLAGVIMGPYGLQMVKDIDHVKLLAEVGVVVLLFTVGLEFSLSRFATMWSSMLSVGLPQMLICGLVGFMATALYFPTVGPAILAGMLLAMSSTAVVLKLFIDRGELGAPHGRVATAVLLFQDLMVLVGMLILPMLAPNPNGDVSLWKELMKGTVAMLSVLLATRYVIPQLLFYTVKTRNRELFLLNVVALCLGTALATASTGLSLALGAFLAGLALSDSEYAQQTLSEALPFRDTLSSLFFVSVGMLLDLSFVSTHLAIVSLTVVSMLALKILAVVVPMIVAGYPLRTAILAGLALAQVGEFSFVMASRGMELGLLGEEDTQIFLASAVVTMAMTPLLISSAPRISNWFPDWSHRDDSQEPSVDADAPLSNHVIICGYGLNGRNVAKTLRSIDIEYLVLEMNPTTVRRHRALGEPIYFGDCSREAILEKAGVHQANTLVIAISDPSTTRRAVQIARELNAKLHIIVRTRYLADMDDLRRLGADEIIPEEFETSVEIFSRVLRHYGIPRNMVLDLVNRLRNDHYGVMRGLERTATRVELPVDFLSKIEVETCALRRDAPAVGRSLKEINLRASTGATVIGVRRGLEVIANPGPEFRFEPNDIIILLGDRAQLERAIFELDPHLEAKLPNEQ